jgi:creatinine amidohydrolase
VHTRSETQKAILTDIVTSLHGQGFRKLVIINGHGGNTFKPYIRDLTMAFPDFRLVVADCRKGGTLRAGRHRKNYETPDRFERGTLSNLLLSENK